jgi:minor extracellular serine protease Vpr
MLVSVAEAQNLNAPAGRLNATAPVKLRIDAENSKVSAITKDLIFDFKSSEKKNTLLSDSKDPGNIYMLRTINERIYTGSLIKVNSAIDEDRLIRAGVLIGTKAGNIWAVQIPVEFLEQLAGLAGLEYLQVDEPVFANLDKARAATYTDWVHNNSKNALREPYKGKDVVVGVIDLGFDFTHPQFYDSEGENLRISRCWIQTAKTGTRPSGFGYGHEIVGETALLNARGDSYETHGTHTAGIAAGSGIATDGAYVGVAPESEIIMVSYSMGTEQIISTGQSSIVDAINYIFQRAEAQGKPAVVNISLGVHIGPHDGTSLYDQACDNLVGPGKIIVASAGNAGRTNLHLSKKFTSSKRSIATFVQPEKGVAMIDIWGQPGYDFEVSISLYNNDQIVSSIEYISSMSNEGSNQTLTGSDGKLCYVYVAAVPSTFNGKPRIFTMVQTASADKILCYVKSTTGEIHMWNGGAGSSAGGRFYSNGKSFAVNGNTTTTVGELGGSGKSTITVGSYTSKNDYTNIFDQYKKVPYYQEEGKLSQFSSLGPTADGRMKPDITAPGHVVVSSVSSWAKGYGGSTLRGEVVYGVSSSDKFWYYAAMQGTSMSAPMVTGIVALMLQANPGMAPDEIKEILRKTAIEDQYTGNIPTSGSNLWGWGKIDAHEALKKVRVNPFPHTTVLGDLEACMFVESVYSHDITSTDFLVKWDVTGGEVQGSIFSEETSVIWDSEDGTLGLIRKEKSSGYTDTVYTSVEINSPPDKPEVFLSGERIKSGAMVGNQWFFEGELIEDATSKYYSPTQTGNYSVQVTKNDCVSEMSDEYYYDMSGVENSAGQTDKIDIYPNPADKAFVISFVSDTPANVSVRITDLIGKEILVKEFAGLNTQFRESVSVDNLHEGIYFAEVTIGTKKFFEKIVVKH